MTTTELTARTANHDNDLAELVNGAKAGCPTSWRKIVRRFDEQLQRVARVRGLDAAAAADVTQQTWLIACTNIDSLRDPQALSGWLHSILHHECIRTLRRRQREAPHSDETDLFAGMRNGRAVMMHSEPRSPEEEALRVEQRMLVQTARRRLPRRDQHLLALLTAEPRLPYTEISRRLGLPVGSIGPTRARCLTKLRRELTELGMTGV